MTKKQLKTCFREGFSLIEIVVVLGLLAGAGVFLGQILNQSQKGQKKVSANLDFTTKMWEVFNVVQNTSYCNGSTNFVFKEKAAAGALVPAKLSSENTPTTNTVNWIGYQLGSGAAAQNIKVLEEGDVIENTLTVSQITFERQKDTAGNIVSARASTPVGTTTHYVNLVITANPTSGSGFPVTKSFKLNLISSTPAASPTNEVVGCVGSNARIGSPDLDTGWLTYVGGPLSNGITWDSTNSGYKVNFNAFPNTLGSNPDTFLVDVQYRATGGTGVLAARPQGTHQLTFGSTGSLESVWRQLTATSIMIDPYDASPPAVARVRVRIWDTGS